MNKIALLSIFITPLFLVGCDDSTDRVPVPQKVSYSAQDGADNNTPCGEFAPWGFPQFNPPQLRTFFLCHDGGGKATEFNAKSRTPMWVAEHLVGKALIGGTNIEPDFRVDTRLADGPKPADYAKTNKFIPGQLAPSADFPNSKKQQSLAYYLSNTVPQDPANNKGIWRLLENNTRQWAVQYDHVYVVSGPVFYNGVPMGYIGSDGEVRLMNTKEGGRRGLEDAEAGRVAIPTHLYKIIYAPKINQMIAFLIPNSPLNPADLGKYVVPVSTVEFYTGLKFFPQLPADTQQKIKNQIPLWNLKM